MKTITTKGATIHYRPDNIIHVHYDNVLFSLEDIQAIFNATRENSPWDIAPVYITGGTFTNQEPEARKFSGSETVMQHCSAVAFLSKTSGEKLLANFFITFIKPSKPTKFFSTEKAAINWLKNFESIAKK